MLELAIAGTDRFAIDRRELDRGDPRHGRDARGPGRRARRYGSGAAAGRPSPVIGELRQPPLGERLRALGEVRRLRAQLLRGDLQLERRRERRACAAASITRFASPTAIGAQASSSSTSCLRRGLELLGRARRG